MLRAIAFIVESEAGVGVRSPPNRHKLASQFSRHAFFFLSAYAPCNRCVVFSIRNAQTGSSQSSTKTVQSD